MPRPTATEPSIMATKASQELMTRPGPEADIAAQAIAAMMAAWNTAGYMSSDLFQRSVTTKAAKPMAEITDATLPSSCPADRPSTTMMPMPRLATSMANQVRPRMRSPRKMRASSAVKKGEVPNRNAALATVVFFKPTIEPAKAIDSTAPPTTAGQPAARNAPPMRPRALTAIMRRRGASAPSER